ncbi:hypothetical protein [Pedobacter caeni]|uniref:Uncharacterized protein n=1 Tax=Pedobacter caeni TaxID=288992 RepID=A0A1M5IY28_9SPHI|nr:hypothetical protein [Pedobacter caeni]SHG33035.1 hypothetical protein SAMN04488522_105107 [Pedobacter caeni]
MREKLKNYFAGGLFLCALTIATPGKSKEVKSSDPILLEKRLSQICMKLQEFYPHDGIMYRYTEDGAIYINMFGQARHIQDANTLYGVFIKNVKIINVSLWPREPFQLPLGAPLTHNTRIVYDTTDGKTYLQMENFLVYISSPAAAQRYKFDLKKAQNINGTSGYRIGGQFSGW